MLAELTSWGLIAIASPSAQDAINLLSKTHEIPSVLIVDKRLSLNETGIEAISALREELNEDTAAILMTGDITCLLYTSPSPRDRQKSRMPSSA